MGETPAATHDVTQTPEVPSEGGEITLTERRRPLPIVPSVPRSWPGELRARLGSWWPNEPPLTWASYPWAYRSRGPVPRRHNPRQLPIHAPEFSRLWSDEYRAALLSASGSTRYNGVPLLRAWFGTTLGLLRLPWWSLSFRVVKILSDYRDTPPPRTHHELANWYPRPRVPAPWADLTPYTSKRLLDGFAPFPLLVSDDGREVVLDHVWNDVALRGPYELPNVRVTWRVDGAPTMTSIRIASRRRRYRRRPLPDGVGSDDPRYFDVRTVTPANGAAWHHAQFVARCVSLVRGQTDVHLARTHLLVESVALCFEVHGTHPRLRRPLARLLRLLKPFLRDVSGINRLGDALVLEGQGLLPRSTGLDDTGVGQRLSHQLAEVDWRGFAPRPVAHPVLGQDHRYGMGANAFWEGIERFVDEEMPALHPEEQLAEIAALREVLSAHAAHVTTPEARVAPEVPGFRPLWPNEQGRPRRGPGHLSLPETLDDLRAFCRFVIFHASFVHGWVNDTGWTDGGSLYHAAFGLRHLDPPARWDEAHFVSWWESALPRVSDCVPQLAVGWVLHHTRWGLVDHPDEPYRMESRDKGDHLPVVRRFVRAMRATSPHGGSSPADRLVSAGLAPLEQWRIRVNT